MDKWVDQWVGRWKSGQIGGWVNDRIQMEDGQIYTEGLVHMNMD
jgi:hypothetical protein